MTPEQYAANIARALDVQDQSVRLQAAMAAGTHPHPDLLETLVRRCGVEPDFFVRETLAWALTRLPADDVLPRVQRELASKNIQARTQALHVLSKVGDERAWPWITPEFLHDADDDLARTAWRAAAALAPQSQHGSLADELVEEFGRGDAGTQMALSVALLGLGDAAVPAVRSAIRSQDAAVTEHARATDLLRTRPELAFDGAVEEAKRIVALGGPGA
ncbi:HEAT repeat protein [Dermacoccus sp. SAI-028]|nr:HEAT repeat domain-containing protein [Dermacoccus sp. SAI-028]TCJ90684.1 HEAT repeat protein [Dermacoccus sp. SAI-028]